MKLLPRCTPRPSTVRAIRIAIVVAGALLCACVERTARPLFTEVSSIVAQRSGRSLPVQIGDPAEVRALVDEINGTRQEGWERFSGKPGACSLVLRLQTGRTERWLRVGKTALLEEDSGHPQSGYVRSISLDDLPRLRSLQARIPPQRGCGR